MPSVSRHLIDPELVDLLDQFPTEPLSNENLGAIREAIRVPMPGDVAAPSAPLVESTRRIPGPRGAPEVEILTYAPESVAAATGCIFHIHGSRRTAGSRPTSAARS
jgi:triacylglycerol lipase